MKLFRDTENGYIMSESELMQEFEALKAEQPDEYDYTFAEYVKNCTSKNGFLEAFEGETIVERAAAYLDSCGVDAAMREKLRAILLEE